MGKEFNRKLLVEGKDDQHVILALCKKFNIAQNFEVIDCEGITKLEEQIPIRLKTHGIETIGIIIDADANIESRWKSLSALLSFSGYNVPDKLPSTGLILNPPNKVKIGVWIMPDNNLNGMLEDFMRFLVPEDDKLLTIAKDSLTEIENENLNKYLLIHKSKALIHTWLAWQDDPGTPMGLAITKKYLTTEKEICTRFIEWIKLTFSE